MNFIDQIRALNIETVLAKYIELKPTGANFKAKCPFHNEKTPSLVVTPAKNIFKCFGCGVGGDAISFVMEHESVEFYEACKIIARNNNITIPEKEYTQEEQQQFKKLDGLRVVTKMAASWFEANLWLPENKQYLDYALSRWTEETIRTKGIGYAPDAWHALEEWGRKSSITRDALIDTGLIKISSSDKTNTFDFFRNRLMFPIHDHMGRIIAFTGRSFNPKDPKYLNSPENEIYSKGNILFGFDVARRHIANSKLAILVEGNADVLRMHELGILNTVASSGTALTDSQVKRIAETAESVSIIGDNDNAGIAAMIKNGLKLIEAGLFVNIIQLPVSETKIDPDSFFTSKDQYDTFAKENIESYPIWMAKRKLPKSKSDDGVARTINEVCEMLIYLPETIRDLQITSLSKLIGNKQTWNNSIKKIIATKAAKENAKEIESDLTPEQSRSKNQYGFYIEGNCYYFATKDYDTQGSNFIMKPLFHVASVMNAKRLYEITNCHGHVETIELAQRDMISLQSFKLRVESLGNYLWEMPEVYFNKLKKFLYDETQSCTEITQLGWNSSGFFAWSNGIFNDEFTPTDKYGIVAHNNVNYYLPASSVIYKNEPTLFQFERKFIHTATDHINLHDYVTRFHLVFGDNALIGFSFMLASLFRDIIANRFGFFPLLNAFGPKGAGKTEMAISLMSFFGTSGKGPNINNTSKAALGDHVSQVSNACVHIDEYRNDIEIEKIEFLKGIWDGTGRSRMNMDKDKKKETTAVDCGVILTGQQMPTADIALFSRLVYITFNQTEYTAQEKNNFVELKDIEKHGLSHLTNEILTHRTHVFKNYAKSYDKVCADIQARLKIQIEDRIFRNWAVLVATAHCLIHKISVPFNYEKLLDITIAGLITQAAETRSSNELSTFWTMVQYMDNENLIAEKADYRLEYTNKISTDKGDIITPAPQWILYVHFGRIINLYRKLGRQQGANILPPDTVKHYLINSSAYLGWKNSIRFLKLDRNGLPINKSDGSFDKDNYVTTVTSAYCFKYEELGISLSGFDPEKRTDMPF